MRQNEMAGSQKHRWLWFVLVVGAISWALLWPSSARAGLERRLACQGLPALAELQPDPSRSTAARALVAPEAEGDDDDRDHEPPQLRGRGGYGASGIMGGMFSRYGYMTLMALAYFYFTSRDSRGSGFAGGRGTYYLFWLVGPTLLAIFLEHPAFLGVVAVGLVAVFALPGSHS
jgi:hypothetical protein